MTDAKQEARRQAEVEFAIICSAGGTDNLDDLFGDHHLAFERIWLLARHAALADARAIVRQVPPRQPKDSSAPPEEMDYTTLAEDFRADILDALKECE